MRLVTRLVLAVLLFCLVAAAPTTAQVLQQPPAAPCICTPLVGNYPITATETWWVQARGGNLDLTLIGRAVNSTDLGSVSATAYDSGGFSVGMAVIAYPAGQPIGTEFSSSFPVIAAAPGAIYRIDVTTPGAPATQSHYRLKAQGASWIATDSPSFAGFEEGHVRWLFNVQAGEPLDVKVSTFGTPTTTTDLTYQWIDPSGVALPVATTTVPDPASPVTLSVATPAAGQWVLDLISTEHYTLDKTGGADRKLYLDWYSAGDATLDGLILLNGFPNPLPVDLIVRDAHTGTVVATQFGVTNIIPTIKLISGDYIVHVVVPPGVNPVPDIPVHLECDQHFTLTIRLTSQNPTGESYPLNVARVGTGTGTVTSAPGGIFCGAACSANFTAGTMVTLTAMPDPGSVFAGWSGACTGMGACTVLMDAAKNVTATFNKDGQQQTRWTLNVIRHGGGTARSTPGGLVCGTSCVETYTDGTIVTLNATPDPGWVFAGWSGICTGTGTCTVLMDADKTVEVTFTQEQQQPKNYPLSVFRAGTGTGTVTSAPAGIFCGAACGTNFTDGTLVTLTATPDAGSSFAGWSGDCSGTGTCTVTMNAARNVTATFAKDPVNYTLTVARTGSGTVTSSPLAIFCGSACSGTFADGTVVTLTATPDAGWAFAGWSGACTGTGTCTVTMDANKNVTATFTEVRWALTTTRTGSGTVTSSPLGIFCGAACSSTWSDGSVVTLTATPAAGWSFEGWSGACTGTGTCTLTMNSDKAVTATFTQDPVNYTLTVARAGSGSGTVTSAPAGIFCGSACAASYVDGTVVTLTATPAAGSTFTGWSGACTGTGTCTVTMDANKNVTATFAEVRWTLTTTRTGSGTVTSSPLAIYCGATCSATFNDGSVVTLTATPDAGWTFAGWSGACTGTGTCTLTMNSDKAVTATFTRTNRRQIMRMNGEGQLDTNADRIQFHFDVTNRIAGELELEVEGRRKVKFESADVKSATFSDNPSLTPGGNAVMDTVVFTGTGRWNGKAGYSYEVRATDQGEPGRNDTVSIVIRDSSGAIVLQAAGAIRGNVQSTVQR